MLIKSRIRTDYAKSPVTITQGEGYHPIHSRVGGNFLDGLPGNIGSSTTQIKHRVQHQLKRRGSRANNQINIAYGT
jgi:molybdopterin biosynthesis enzyme